jgi:aminoglycoside N3'-acetyltransferase
MDGWALLIGVGIDRCSSMHQAEKVGFPNEIVRCFQVPEEILIDYPADTWSVGYGSTPEDGWAKVWDEANRQGLVRQGRMGQADCKLFKARAMAGIYENWLRIDPYGLFGVQRDE